MPAVPKRIFKSNVSQLKNESMASAEQERPFGNVPSGDRDFFPVFRPDFPINENRQWRTRLVHNGRFLLAFPHKRFNFK